MVNIVARFHEEGEQRTIHQVCRRRTCEECGERADHEVNYILAGARSNPASSAYGRDEIIYCSDSKIYVCPSCKRGAENTPPDGYEWCATFNAAKQYAHLFIEWVEEPHDEQG